MAALTCLFLHVCSAEADRTCFRSSRPACTLFQHIKQIYQESNMTGYPSKKPEGPAKVEQVNTYRNGTAPRAAEFGKGARNLAEIQQATDARRENSAQWSRKSTGPRPTANRDSRGE
jgi:hypothetical protein